MFLQPIGPFSFVAAEDIEDGVLVQFGAAGQVFACGVAGTPCGFTRYSTKAGDDASVYQAIGEAALKVTLGEGESVGVGDYMTSNGLGRLVVGATAAAVDDARTRGAALSVSNIVAVAISATSTDGDYIKVFFLHSA